MIASYFTGLDILEFSIPIVIVLYNFTEALIFEFGKILAEYHRLALANFELILFEIEIFIDSLAF